MSNISRSVKEDPIWFQGNLLELEKEDQFESQVVTKYIWNLIKQLEPKLLTESIINRSYDTFEIPGF